MKTIASAVSTILLSALLVVCFGCKEVQELHFDNLDRAKEAHMVEKGWLPSALPADTRQIRLKEDIDIASVYGSFISEKTGDLQRECSERTEFRLPKNGPRWFPQELREANTFADLRIEGYQLLSCDRGEFTIAFRPSGGTAYFWSLRR